MPVQLDLSADDIRFLVEHLEHYLASLDDELGKLCTSRSDEIKEIPIDG